MPFFVSGFTHVLCNSPSHVPCMYGTFTSQRLKTRNRQNHFVNAKEKTTKIVTTSGSFFTASQLIDSGVPVKCRTATQIPSITIRQTHNMTSLFTLSIISFPSRSTLLE